MNTLSSSDNQTIVYNQTGTRGFTNSNYTYTFNDIQISMVILGVVGLFGNGIAMNIIRKGRDIKKNSSYILLFNQSLADFLSCLYIMFDNFVVPRFPNTSMSGVVDWLICALVKSHYIASVTTVLSSFNLAAIAAERMVSIAYPIHHRKYVDAPFQKRVVVSLWSVSVATMIPLTITKYGIDPRGNCYMFNKLRNGAAIVHVVAFETWTLLNPLLVIMCSYVRIVVKLYSSDVQLKRRGADVLKTLLTVVVVYFSCAILKSTISISTAFGHPVVDRMTGLVSLGFLLRTISFIVNPLIYTLQYKDYRTELRRQAEQVCPRLCGIGSVGVHDNGDTKDMSVTTVTKITGIYLQFTSSNIYIYLYIYMCVYILVH